MHQIGHLFGLDHSSNPKSVMSPLFHFDSDQLLEEDVKNLRMILGLESSELMILVVDKWKALERFKHSFALRVQPLENQQADNN